MAYLVRKLNKRARLDDLAKVRSIEDVYADIPTTEFRTKDGTLSTWRIQTRNELDNAALVIALMSTELSTMDFIVIDTNLLDDNDLEYKQTDAGPYVPIPDLKDTHYDIVNITVNKLCNCTNVFRSIVLFDNDNGKYIVRYPLNKVKALIKDADDNQRLDDSHVNKEIKAAIEEIRKNS